MKKYIYSIFIIALVLPLFAFSQNLMTPELLWSLKRLGSATLSPNGNLIAYTVSQPNLEDNKTTAHIYLLNLKEGTSRQITYEGSHNYNPVWSPDSKTIAFISDRNDMPQVYFLELSGGDPKQITNLENGVSNLAWSPKGKFLSFTSDVKVDFKISEIYKDLDKVQAKIYKDLPVRHWDEWNDENYRHLFIYDIQNNESKDLMTGEKFDTPLKPFGGSSQIAWSPEESEIAYTCKKVENFESTTNSSIYIAPVYGGKANDMTIGNAQFPLKGFDMEPKYSPNGSYIAFKSQKREGFESDKIRLILFSRKTGRYIDLTEKFDYWVDNFVWSPNSNYIYFSAIKNGRSQIFKVNIDSKKIETVISGTYNYADRYLEISPDGKILYFNRRNYNNPDELFKMPIDGNEQDIVQLTNINTEQMSSIKKAKIEERWINTRDGKKLHTWLVLPPDFDPNKKYPMITYCQGGPQQAVSQYWSYGWNFLLMASKGYVILAPNRRGCPGFGQEWVDAISQDWGGAAMNDILDATDSLSNEPFIDKNRLAAIGGSAGGFTTFWLEGNHNKRFKAFVSHCGVFNIESKHGSTEELWFPNWEFGGEFLSAKAKENYKKFSPHNFADKWDTPILIITGEKDFRVPYDQSLQAFTLAQIKGIPSELIVYPNENHWVLHPQEEILWYREFFKFLDNYVK